jgi:hypothetical protein
MIIDYKMNCTNRLNHLNKEVVEKFTDIMKNCDEKTKFLLLIIKVICKIWKFLIKSYK